MEIVSCLWRRGRLVVAAAAFAFGMASAPAMAQSCGDPEAGDCCVDNGTPFCDDAACCEAVCAADPFCCDNTWDGVCADAALEICLVCAAEPACGLVGTGDCCEANGTPFCDDAECCAEVCAVDPFCCETEWDGLCAEEAAELCVLCGGAPAGACCFADTSCEVTDAASCVGAGGVFQGDGVACEDVECMAPMGCFADLNGDGATDALDLGILLGAFGSNADGDLNGDGMTDALDLGILLGNFGCVECGAANAGDCCEANGTPFCNDAECCELVCAEDPFCCETEWDTLCAGAALENCVVCFECGSANSGDCCEANGTPFCNDAECCELVCADDPFCCETEWDQICANDAAENCAVCADVTGACCLGDGSCVVTTADDCAAQEGTYEGDNVACEDVFCITPLECGSPAAGNCCENNGSAFCDDAACCEAVCAADPFCCDSTWDQICADAALETCLVCGVDAACGVAGTGDCCEPNGSAFCDDAECCELVCSLDPFCCDNQWDGLCAGAAADSCALCQP